MNAEKKIIRHKLSVLELAETLGNITSACRRRGVSRTSFYEWKKRFKTHGIEGLKDFPPISKNHPFTTPKKTVNRIIMLSLSNPSRGCKFIEHLLSNEGTYVSSVTIQKHLDEAGLGKRYSRWLRLEGLGAKNLTMLSATQIAFIEKQNPQFKERHVESSKPGELLNQDTFYVGRLKGVGKVYLHVAVDTFSSHGFGILHFNKKPEAAVAVLHNEVLPFYEKHRLKVENILTDNGTEFRGTDTHPYQIYLNFNDINHRTTKVRRPQTNGFVERFNRTVLDEFFRIKFKEKLYTDLKSLQKDLDKWLIFYNQKRPHQGYRNMGNTPLKTITNFVHKEG